MPHRFFFSLHGGQKTLVTVLFRSNSFSLQVDLVGGYYDAGDNVKFGLPMAFTITMMSWSIIEYGKQILHTGELSHSLASVKWGTDYLIKAHPEPNVLYGEVCRFLNCREIIMF